MQTLTVPTTMKHGNVRPTEFFVQITNNYSMFKKLGENRVINMLHVKRLIESFRICYLICPIIVNELLEIVDGQHRHEACRLTGFPIYFIVVPGYGIKEISILNSNQKNWTKLDFLESYCAQDIKPYLEFKQFMTEFPELGFQSCERIITGYAKGTRTGLIDGERANMRDFQEGKLRIPNLNKSYANARKIMEYKPHYEGFNRPTFVTALLPLLSSKVYNHKEMIYKLGVSPHKLEHCSNVFQYRDALENIYNWKRLKDNKVSFRYE